MRSWTFFIRTILYIYRNLTLVCIWGARYLCFDSILCIVALWVSMFSSHLRNNANVCILMDIYDGQNGLIYALWWVMMTLTFYCTLTLTQWAWLDYFSKWVSSLNWIYYWVKRISMTMRRFYVKSNLHCDRNLL